jgi:hypothetical protein
MTKAKSLVVVAILALTGCTDTIDSISREYRNANNEVIDAVMAITSEQKAKDINARIFKTIPERYKKMDDKLKNYETNQATNLEMVTNYLTSDGVQLLIADRKANVKRFDVAMKRLKELYEQYINEAREAQGNDFDENAVAPTIRDIIRVPSHPLVQFEKQLNTSEIETKMAKWDDKPPKGVPDQKYKELKTEFDKRQTSVFEKERN